MYSELWTLTFPLLKRSVSSICFWTVFWCATGCAVAVCDLSGWCLKLDTHLRITASTTDIRQAEILSIGRSKHGSCWNVEWEQFSDAHCIHFVWLVVWHFQITQNDLVLGQTECIKTRVLEPDRILRTWLVPDSRHCFRQDILPKGAQINIFLK